MNVPVLVLLGFAAWTLLILFGSIGVYRWSRILTGRASMAEWRADLPQGSDWYQRTMRAHMNCVENLPVYAAIVGALVATGLRSPVVDRLSVTMLAARIGQTMVHIALSPTNAVTSLRFALYFMQAVCMIAMGVVIVVYGVFVSSNSVVPELVVVLLLMGVIPLDVVLARLGLGGGARPAPSEPAGPAAVTVETAATETSGP